MPVLVLEARMAARSLLNRYGIDKVEEIVVQDLAFGVGLRFQIAPISGADGRLVRDAKNGLATVNKSINNQNRRRFIMAHELGHYQLHRDVRLFSCDAAAFLDWNGKRPLETEANQFAAELLMPAPLFRDDASGRPCSIDTLRALSDVFRVSLSATAIRYVNLDICPSAVVFSKDGFVVWGVLSDSFRYKYLPTRRKTHPFSGAGEFFSRGIVADSAEETPCSAWFSDHDITPNDSCYEQCLPMPSINAVLSLIWT